ncbi:MAG: hypothetical protein L6R40_003472 [Gallowayella cf. fulva]|nr:MAG: hypothetical protein L6R40_003472 [Xanthomendoza cf. fulva]
MSTNTERGERPPGDKPELLVVNKAIKRRWQKYLWDSLDKPSQERKFLFKLDAALMTFAFLGIQYVIGSWYRSDELAKRSSIVLVSAAIAIMCSGYLMTAVNHLGGVGGYAGWQWLFIVDGIISLPIALAGYAFIPDLPETSRAFYLSQEVTNSIKNNS